MLPTATPATPLAAAARKKDRAWFHAQFSLFSSLSLVRFVLACDLRFRFDFQHGSALTLPLCSLDTPWPGHYTPRHK